ncbi:SIS domain-containing protein [Streptomyces sp. 3MP-14]|uniref:SIS domain-containing protein n=1 Tax=Streptomyces mimosae TaxID=2586635 RepID=A0A5N6APZ6_9ACTN|nr:MULTISPECIES: MurR/RpiR family transcriptional regulator [Streptomyces]KAB8169769.1 SIS domain-containing protein [Streptomyces mimosae]KAB8178517.1 SIS domain-containing protein [Streptomyces sp. 3MP-14]
MSDTVTNEPLAERLRAHGAKLPRAERTVAEYLVTVSPDELPFLNANQIAEATGTSDASVIRAARSLGFTGLPELKRVAARAHRSRSSRAERVDAHLTALGDDARAVTEAFHGAMRELLDDNEQLIDRPELERARAVIRSARTVWSVGIGTSGAAALYLADQLTRAGYPARWTRATGFDLANELLAARPEDAIVLFHAARRAREFTDVIDWAGRAGVPVVLVTGTQLAERHRHEVAATLRCVGTASELARWTIAAVQLAELLAVVVAAGDPARSADAHRRLTELRRTLTDDQTRREPE